MRKLIAIVVIVLTVAACSRLPEVPYLSNVVYRPPVQQGNVISSKAVAQLHAGMTQEQVLQLLGEPILRAPYHDNRWHYVYTYTNHRSNLTAQKRLTLYFNNGVLTRYTSTVDKGTGLSTNLPETTLPLPAGL